MPCDVWLYDDSLAAIKAGVFEVSETDHWGVKIDIKTAQPLGASGELGAQLVSPVPPEPVKIFVDDLSGTYSPASLGELHGGLPAKLDIALYPLPMATARPKGGSGPSSSYPTSPGSDAEDAPATSDAISTFISNHVESGEWSESEGAGVRTLYETVTRALNCPRLDQYLVSRRRVWIESLAELGIRVKSSSGQSSPGAAPMRRMRAGSM